MKSYALTDYVNEAPGVFENLERLFNNLRIKPTLRKALVLPSTSCKDRSHSGVVGMAYDYAFRWELKRRGRTHAIEGKWIADDFETSGSGDVRQDINRTHLFVDDYVMTSEPQPEQVRELCRLAVRMGRLDPAARRIPGCTTEGYDRDRACETDDTFKLFRNTSFNEIPTSKAMYLNPRLFNQGRPITSANGKAQCSQGDLDVIVGDVLIDLKTTQNRRVNARDVCQILGYYMTTVIHRQSNIRSWPDIKYLCLYYPRFNEIVKIETSVVQKNSHWLSALYAFGGNASGVKSRLASTVNGSN